MFTVCSQYVHNVALVFLRGRQDVFDDIEEMRNEVSDAIDEQLKVIDTGYAMMTHRKVYFME